MTLDTLQHSIAKKYGTKASAELSPVAVPCIDLSAATSDTKEEPNDPRGIGPGSRVGGTSLIPAGVGYPVDNRGRPFLFLGLLNFAEFDVRACSGRAPHAGVLLWFLNVDLSFKNPKDRHSFKILWTVEDGQEWIVGDDASAAFLPPCRVQGNLSACIPNFELQKIGLNAPQAAHQLFGVLPKRSEECKEVAAFAANGISWSDLRRKDSCYEHLVASAAQWHLLWLVPSALSGGQLPDLALLIHDEDLSAGLLHKAWMVPL